MSPNRGAEDQRLARLEVIMGGTTLASIDPTPDYDERPRGCGRRARSRASNQRAKAGSRHSRADLATGGTMPERMLVSHARHIASVSLSGHGAVMLSTLLSQPIRSLPIPITKTEPITSSTATPVGWTYCAVV
jgi:hypothetical protein